MAILGYNTKGSVAAAFTGAGAMWVAKFTLATAGTLTELHGWFGGGTGQAVRIVVYDDDAGGALPGTRLAYSASITLPASGDFEAVDTALSVPLTAGDYWVGYICQGTTGTFYREATGSSPSHQAITSGASYSPPPSPFGTPSSSGTRNVSCWGVVGTSAPGGTASKIRFGTALAVTDQGAGVIRVDAAGTTPVGGTRGQALTKQSSTDGDSVWSPRVSFPPDGVGGDIVFGGDTNISRSGPGILRASGEYIVGGGRLYIRNSAAPSALFFGDADDTYLYRIQAGHLKTDNNFHIGGHLHTGQAVSGAVGGVVNWKLPVYRTSDGAFLGYAPLYST